MLATLDETDQLLLLCNPDVPTLKNVRLTLQTLELLSFPDDRLRVVLNRASTSTGIARADVEAALGRQVDIMLPLDPAVPLAVNRAEAVVLEATPTPFGGAIIELARSIGGGAKAPAPHVSRSQKRFSFGQELGMSLQQRLNGNDVSDALVLGPRLGRSEEDAHVDRFVELRAELHRACVATVGPELQSLESSPGRASTEGARRRRD